MSNITTCPNCQKKLKINDEFAGRNVACPKCRTEITIPAVKPVQTNTVPALKPAKTNAISEVKSEAPPVQTKYCRTCGATVVEQAVACLQCGVAPKSGKDFCFHCGASIHPKAIICVKCGLSCAMHARGGVIDSGETADSLWGFFVKCISKNYANFNGRARRSEYWGFILFSFLAFFVPLINFLWLLFALVPSLAVFWRRMHDTGRSGLNFLWALIPPVGLVIILIYLCQDSDPDENRYGLNPKSA